MRSEGVNPSRSGFPRAVLVAPSVKSTFILKRRRESSCSRCCASFISPSPSTLAFTHWLGTRLAFLDLLRGRLRRQKAIHLIPHTHRRPKWHSVSIRVEIYHHLSSRVDLTLLDQIRHYPSTRAAEWQPMGTLPQPIQRKSHALIGSSQLHRMSTLLSIERASKNMSRSSHTS